MTIKEVVDLYHNEYKAVEIGTAIASQRLSQGEIEQNRKTAMQRINEFSKEQLIDYILFGDRPQFGTIAKC
jgi:hypothetical protein